MFHVYQTLAPHERKLWLQTFCICFRNPTTFTMQGRKVTVPVRSRSRWNKVCATRDHPRKHPFSGYLSWTTPNPTTSTMVSLKFANRLTYAACSGIKINSGNGLTGDSFWPLLAIINHHWPSLTVKVFQYPADFLSSVLLICNQVIPSQTLRPALSIVVVLFMEHFFQFNSNACLLIPWQQKGLLECQEPIMYLYIYNHTSMCLLHMSVCILPYSYSCTCNFWYIMYNHHAIDISSSLRAITLCS